MLDIFPYAMMFIIFGFMSWVMIGMDEKINKLKAEKSELIKLRNLEVKELREVIRELRDCTNQFDKCTVWECNCI